MKASKADIKAVEDAIAIQAIANALELLESLGYSFGDIHDDLECVLNRLKRRAAAEKRKE